MSLIRRRVYWRIASSVGGDDIEKCVCVIGAGRWMDGFGMLRRGGGRGGSMVALVTSPSVARYWVYIGASTHQQPNADDRSAVSRTWVIPTVQAKL